MQTPICLIFASTIVVVIFEFEESMAHQ